MFALEFPPIENLVEWPAYLGDGTALAFNKIALISFLAMLIPSVLFLMAKKDLVPRGVQNLVEATIEFLGLSLEKEKPVPPPDLWIRAVFLTASKIDSMASSIGNTKQAESCPNGRPAFIRVGELGRNSKEEII